MSGIQMLLAASSGLAPKFNFGVGSSYTIRPATFGSIGMTNALWNTVFSSVSAPWTSSIISPYTSADVLSFINNPNEVSRGNPAPQGMFGVTGWPAGIYEFTLAGGGGADADPGFGAPGGLGTGRVALLPTDVVYFAVGQGGIYTGGAARSAFQPWYYPNPGGWNGGGAGGAQGTAQMYSGSGGGSTDIRINGSALANRLMIAGGGGGATDQNYNTGGYGGAFNQNGQLGGYGPSSFAQNAGQGGTQSAGGSGALYGGILFETYMNGALWSGGRGYDGTNAVGSANAAGGGGGGYYGGGGAVDETPSTGGGTGGGSGYANTGSVSNISGTNGGAANGNPSWTWSAPTVNGSGHSLIDYTGSTFTPSINGFDNAQYTAFITNGGTSAYVNRRCGGNGYITVSRVS